MLRRTLLSALLAGVLLSTQFLAVTLQLNPHVSPWDGWRALLLSLWVPWVALGWAALALLAAALTGLRFWPEGLKRPVRALPWFTSLVLAALLAATAVAGFNLWNARYAVPVTAIQGLATLTAGLALGALALLFVCLDALLFPYRSRRVSAALVKLVYGLLLILPLALRPAPPPTPARVRLAMEPVASTRRLVLLAVDGLGPAELQASAASGSAPALAQLLRRGAFGPLATLRPTEGPAVWASIFTGRYPRDHGIKSFSAYALPGSAQRFDLLPKATLVPWLERGGFVERVPLSADARRGPALWNALNALGLHAGVVRFWGTYPPERVKGFMLSHVFHQLLRDQPGRAGTALYPPDLADQVQARAVDPRRDQAAVLEAFVDLTAPLPPGGAERERDLVERALAPDLTYERAGLLLRSAYDPPFFALSLYGYDVLGHSFRRYAHPEEFGNVPADELRRWGQLQARYTAHVDGLVGRLAAELRPDEVLLVVSGYGLRPVAPWRRGLAFVTGGSIPDGLHDDAPDGFVLAVGDGVRPRAAVSAASVLDIAPTVLYLMGLPVARDMEGRVLVEALQPGFVRRQPLTYIPSYESLAVTELASPGELPLLPEPEP